MEVYGLAKFKKCEDLRGCLIPIESYKDIPFNIDRVFFIKNMDNIPRGFHAHKKTTQAIFPIVGSFTIDLTDGDKTESFHLDSDQKALIIPTYTWLSMHSFTSDCVIVVLCSYPYDEKEYIRNYDDYKATLIERKSKNTIKTFDLTKQTYAIRSQIDLKIRDLIDNSRFVLGPELESFETAFAHYNDIKHCVGVSNGTSALIIALKALKLQSGDKVIVQSNTYIAAPLAVEQCGLQIKIVDVDADLNLDLQALEEALTEDVKAVIVVHLYGMSPDMNKMMSLKEKYGFYLIEDAAQAHGSTFDGKKLGTFGDLGCFSFYPSKNLGCFGEGGCIVTNNDDYAQYARLYRNYGSVERYQWEIKGSNERMHNIQAAILHLKLPYLDQWNENRNAIARIYDEYLSGLKQISVPNLHPLLYRNYHLYVVLTPLRDLLQHYLQKQGIVCAIHYPETFYKSPAFAGLNHLHFKADTYKEQLLSLPIYPEMPIEHAKIICGQIKNFFHVHIK
jgi:dTDP-4-amino-4,6-dideoxygalactose transaminase/dTDP-4-dehydrorhamnose 3,5-epimerase-like enzyme